MKDSMITIDLPEIEKEDIISVTTEKEDLSLPMLISAFSGADMIPAINGVPIGETCKIEYTQSFDDARPSTGKIKTILFRESPIEPHISGFIDDFTIFFGDEYGNKAMMEFKDFKLIKKEGSHVLDDIFLSETYHFEFSRSIISERKWITEKRDSQIIYIADASESEISLA